MKPPFPHRYISTITRVGHSIATIDAPPRTPLTGGPPPELHGDPRTWSPEHLLVSALGLCLFATFEAFAAREHIAVFGWRDVATGLLDKTSSGLAFKSFTIQVEITVGSADIEKTREVLERASLLHHLEGPRDSREDRAAHLESRGATTPRERQRLSRGSRSAGCGSIARSICYRDLVGNGHITRVLNEPYAAIELANHSRFEGRRWRRGRPIAVWRCSQRGNNDLATR